MEGWFCLPLYGNTEWKGGSAYFYIYENTKWKGGSAYHYMSTLNGRVDLLSST